MGGRLVLAELAPDPVAHLVVAGHDGRGGRLVLLMLLLLLLVFGFCFGFVGTAGAAAVELEKGADHLAVVRVLEADHNRLGDGGVGDQALFDLEGVDVFAALVWCLSARILMVDLNDGGGSGPGDSPRMMMSLNLPVMEQ